MGDNTMKILNSMLASSAIENLELNREEIDTVVRILDGKMTLQDYLAHLNPLSK